MVYRNCNIVSDGVITENRDVETENGKITAILPAGSLRGGIDLCENYLAPGFIDIHCHGGAGYEFADATEQAVINAAAIHAAHGTAVLYPTLSSASFDALSRALEAIGNAKDKCALEIAGVHLEGPFLSSGMSGAQNPSVIHAPLAEEYVPLADKYGDLIARWSYAPELDKDNRFARFLQERGIVAATAHSDAEYSDVMRAFGCGNRLVTHLYSCTSTVIRHKGFRRLGVIESAFLNDGIYVEAIADGKHLPPELLKMIYKIKGEDRVCLVTDAIRSAGAADGTRGVSSGVEYIVEDGVAKLTDRSAFAGSIATADRLLRCACDAGIPLANAVKMLTQTPAEVMGLKNKGRAAVGYDAVFTIFDGDLNICKI